MAGTFDDVLACITVEILTPQSGDSFTTASLAYNRRYDIHPAAITYPRTANEISMVVNCSNNAGHPVPIVARSGGHSYAALGLGGEDGSLVVDLSKLNSSTHIDDYVASVVSGVRLGDLVQSLKNAPNGPWALPHGTDPFGGVGGHVAFGGFGPLSRMYGLLSDNVFSLSVVKADGWINVTNADHDPDLFWALRGAAPSFGIVYDLAFPLLPAPPVAINYHITFSKPLTSTQVVQNLLALQTFAFSKPRNELALHCDFMLKGRTVFMSFKGVFYGNSTEEATGLFKETIQPLLSDLANTSQLTTKQFNYYDSLFDLSGNASWDMSQPDSFDTFLAKSVMTGSEHSLLSNESVASWVDWIVDGANSTDLSWWVGIDMFGGMVSSPTSNTSYANRDATLTWQFYGSTPGVQAPFSFYQVDFMNQLVANLVSEPSAAFPNYVDLTLTTDEWQEQYYGEDTLEKLIQVKRANDPQNAFRFPQSIPLPV